MTIIVRWEEIDYSLNYTGETRFCDTWEQAKEYMMRMGKKKYDVEVEE